MRKGEALKELCFRLRVVEIAMQNGNAAKMGSELHAILTVWLPLAEKAK